MIRTPRMPARHPARPAARRAAALLLALATLLGALGVAPPAAATAVIVNRTDDRDNGSCAVGNCTLREAIKYAPAGSTITFNLPAGSTITLLLGELAINKDLTISGPGAADLTVSRGAATVGQSGVFAIGAGTVALGGMTVTGGRTDGAWGAGVRVYSTAGPPTATLTGLVITGNEVRNGGGGGMYISNATVSLVNTTVSANKAVNTGYNALYGGGGLFIDDQYGNASATLASSTVTGNEAPLNSGSGINMVDRHTMHTATLALTGSSVSDNTVGYSGIDAAGTVTLEGSTVSNNGSSGLAASGTVSVTDSTIGGNSGHGISQGYGTLAVVGSTVRDNGGSGVWAAGAATVRGSTFSGNSTCGLEHYNYDALTVDTSTVSANRSCGLRFGFSSSDTRLDVTNSTISGNGTLNGSGGLYLGSGTATVTNTTISGNHAITDGGGVYAGAADQSFAFVTITGNVADDDGNGTGEGGGIYGTGGAVKIGGSIVAGNIDRGGEQPDCVGTFASQGHNVFGPVVGAGTCPAGGTDQAYGGAIGALLDPALADHGGATKTHALVPGSVAINDGGPTCPAADQRGAGFPRPQGAACDAGAYEYTPAAQTIAFAPLANHPLNESPVALAATASSGLPVSFAAVPPDVCTASGPRGSLILLVAPGTCTVTASQAGDASYLAAPPVARAFVVGSPAPPPSPSPSAAPSPSPAPGFADVPPGYWAHDPIGAFARRGITTGCDTDAQGTKYYCPERGVTRAEMAVFLDRTLGHGSPATPAAQRFSDVPPAYWAYAFIDRFAQLGITTGCGGTEFCPDRGVTRAEMAAFLIRALKLPQLTPAAPTFADVPPSHPQYGYIEALVSAGVTTGCGDDGQGHRLYCPDRGVTRAEMAVFITRAFP